MHANINNPAHWPSLKMKALLAIGGLAAGLTAFSLCTGKEWSYRHVAMPLAGLLDPERAHKLSVSLASYEWVPAQHVGDDKILVRIT